MLPKFLCVGAQKSGTTSLHDILIQHPNLFLPEQKETKFFVRDEFYNLGIGYYEKQFFRKAKTGQLAGEIDPDYMYFHYAPQRISHCLGNKIKLIFILRNPVDRAYSHYWMSVRRGYEKLSFGDAVLKEPERLAVGSIFNKLHFSYLDRGRYCGQIENFLRYFPKENMKFIIFEDFVKNIETTVCSIFDFLGVRRDMELNFTVRSNPHSIPRFVMWRDFVYKPNALKKAGRFLLPFRGVRSSIISAIDKLNQKPVQVPLCPEDLRGDLLKEHFVAEIEKLELLLGTDLLLWR